MAALPAEIVGFDPGRYLCYDEMTHFLESCAAVFPGLCSLTEIGRSPEERSVWAVTLTNRETGADALKPGYLIDAVTHAGELTGGAAALYAVWWLLTRYGADTKATELLDTRAFYAIPRVAVDGAEAYLSTPHMFRSSPRRYPETDDPPGLVAEDVNGDGMILLMRLRDPNGDWKADEQDERLLVRRRPEDRGGQYFRVFSEGVLRDWDGRTITPAPSPWRLDFNRNYPAFWHPECKQPGAGPYPLSEPETRAVARFLVDHPNIGAYVAFHTTGEVLLRPPSHGTDDKIPAADLEVFRRIGDLCTRITGAPCKSTYDAFHYPGQEALVKGADDWAYEHWGVQAYTFELWNPDLRSGGQGYAQIGLKGLLARAPGEEAEAQRRLLAWNDRELEGQGFIPWTPFVHPQVGPVEIGGWDWKRSLQNPPEGPLLVEEVTKAAAFVVEHALATPRLALALTAESVGDGLYKLSACVRNLGGLATNVTQQALAMKTARPIEVRLEGDVVVLGGKEKQEIDHLEGWATAGGRAARSEAWVDWLVQAAAGARVRVTAATPRAGTALAGLVLPKAGEEPW